MYNVVFLSPSRQKFGKSLTIHRHRENPCSKCDRCARVRCSWRMKSCYYRSRKHSHTVLSHCTPLEMLDVFRLCVVAEMSVAPASSSPLVPGTVNIQHSPHRTEHAHHSAQAISWPAVYTHATTDCSHILYNLQFSMMPPSEGSEVSISDTVDKQTKNNKITFTEDFECSPLRNRKLSCQNACLGLSGAFERPGSLCPMCNS